MKYAHSIAINLRKQFPRASFLAFESPFNQGDIKDVWLIAAWRNIKEKQDHGTLRLSLPDDLESHLTRIWSFGLEEYPACFSSLSMSSESAGAVRRSVLKHADQAVRILNYNIFRENWFRKNQQ